MEKVYGYKTILPMCHSVGWVQTGVGYLVIPYLHPVEQKDYIRLLEEGHIETVLRKFATSGYLHDDVQWQYFGWWKQPGRIDTLFLTDLEEIYEMEDPEGGEDWVEDCLSYLRQKAEEPLLETKRTIPTSDTKQTSSDDKKKRLRHE